MESRIPIPSYFELLSYGLSGWDISELWSRWHSMTDAERAWFLPVKAGWRLPREPEDA